MSEPTDEAKLIRRAKMAIDNAVSKGWLPKQPRNAGRERRWIAACLAHPDVIALLNETIDPPADAVAARDQVERSNPSAA